MTAWQRNIAVPSGAGSSKEVWFRRQCGIIQMLNLIYFAQVLFIFKLSSGLFVRGCQIAMWFMFSCYWYKIKIIRIIITILNFVHFCWDIQSRFNGSLLCTASNPSPAKQKSILGTCLLWMILWGRIGTRYVIKFSNSITYFRNRTILFCNLFVYRLPPSVILSVNEDSFWNLSWNGKSALSPF